MDFIAISTRFYPAITVLFYKNGSLNPKCLPISTDLKFVLAQRNEKGKSNKCSFIQGFIPFWQDRDTYLQHMWHIIQGTR